MKTVGAMLMGAFAFLVGSLVAVAVVIPPPVTPREPEFTTFQMWAVLGIAFGFVICAAVLEATLEHIAQRLQKDRNNQTDPMTP